MLSVCSPSVTGVHCDKTAEDRIIQFSSNVAQCLTSLPAKFDDEIRRGSLDQGAQIFRLPGAISKTVRYRASVTINH